MRKLGMLALMVCLCASGYAQYKEFSMLGNLRFIWPMQNHKVTSDFGYRDDIKLPGSSGGGDSIHLGVDIIPAEPTKNPPILAMEDGEVVTSYPAPNGYYKGHKVYGGCVKLRHVIGEIEGRKIYAYTLYAHMKQVWVSEFDAQGNPTKVKKGQVLGIMGGTGQVTGPHLHFEILFDPVDILYLSQIIPPRDDLRDEIWRTTGRN